MNFVKGYLIPRLISYFLIIFIGLTIVFIVPRLSPIDPVQQMINTITMMGTYMDPQAVEKLTETLKDLYGLKGNLWQQYIAFWGRFIRGDFGPSFFRFPVPVSKLIADSIPWTIGLLSVSTFLSWLIGNILGGLCGFFYQRKWARILENIAMVIRPIPYYIFALILLLIFGYFLKIFPIAGGFSIGLVPSFSLRFILDLIKYAFLPLISMVILGTAVTLQTMRLIVQNILKEDFVVYAKAGGVKERTLLFKYVIRNAMLPQITGLALNLGSALGGALITELIFNYPGTGYILFRALSTLDYPLIQAIFVILIVAVYLANFIVDFVYAIVDPRIRLGQGEGS